MEHRLPHLPVDERSTKAGDYPRLRRYLSSPPASEGFSALNEGRRLPPATTYRYVGARGALRYAQRRPEITPGYDTTTLTTAANDARAQRRPEITPGYDPFSLLERAHRNMERSTKAGDYPRLRPPTTSRPSTTRSAAQRRPEITPGYDSSWPRSGGVGLTHAQRRPEITPGYDGSLIATTVRTGAAQRRPEITPGYDRVRPVGRRDAVVPGHRSTKAGDYPRLRRCFPAPTCPRTSSAQRRPEITPGYDQRLSRAHSIWLPRAQRRPEITPGYDTLAAAGLAAVVLALNEGRRLPPATTSTRGRGRAAVSTPLNEGRRLPPATTSGVTVSVVSDAPALNEGRRLPPATTPPSPSTPASS